MKWLIKIFKSGMLFKELEGPAFGQLPRSSKWQTTPSRQCLGDFFITSLFSFSYCDWATLISSRFLLFHQKKYTGIPLITNKADVAVFMMSVS
jgi:hypothetical protein